MSEHTCPTCKGRRLNEQVLSVRVGGLNVAEFTEQAIIDALEFVKNIKLTDYEMNIARLVLKEITDRLTFLNNVGLGYLTLARRAGGLSGGEAQRIRLATQIGTRLTGVLYVLDEPTVGLHQRDTSKLISLLRKLRDMGNTVLVVEHDVEMMREADYIIEVGPLAGSNGGRIVNQGRPKDILKMNSLTAKCLAADHKLSHPERRKGNGKYIEIVGAKKNNLKNISAIFPLETMIGVTGVSGSGKSSLIFGVLKEAAEAQ